MLTVEQVAQLTHRGEETVRRWLRSGLLRGIHPTGRGPWLIQRSELQRFLSGAPGGERA